MTSPLVERLHSLADTPIQDDAKFIRYAISLCREAADALEAKDAEIQDARLALAAWDQSSLPNDMPLLAICEARIDDLRKFMDRAEAAESELAALKAKLDDALRDAMKTMRNVRGAIESDQVEDKDARGQLTRGIDRARQFLGGSHDE